MKRERQSRILELIESREIGTQEELVDILRSEGYSVTQATVSRDINELHLGKLPGGNGKRKIAIQPVGDVHLTNKYPQPRPDTGCAESSVRSPSN